MNHTPSSITVLAERSFLRHMGGGCNVPVAVYARLKGNRIHIDGLAASADGRRIVRESVEQSLESAQESRDCSRRANSQSGRTRNSRGNLIALKSIGSESRLMTEKPIPIVKATTAMEEH